MKRALALLLTLCMLLSMAACGEKPTPAPEPEPTVTDPAPSEPAQPAEPEPEPEPAEPKLSDYKVSELDKETLQTAIQETIMAFYNRNPYVQYDLSVLTYESKASGSPKRTTFMSPENAGFDTEHFSQCSEFCYDVYEQAFGWDGWMGDRFGYGNRIDQPEFKETLVTAFDEGRGYTDQQEALRYLKEESEPGDVVLGYGTSGDGHVLIVLGDYYHDGRWLIAHCWPVGGGSLNVTTGTDGHEPNGSIVIQTIEDVLLTGSGSPNWCVASGKGGARWYLFRPLLHKELQEYTLTPATVSRMEHPNMGIEKVADRYIYGDILEGEDVTVTETITNHGTQDYTAMSVVEYVPEGCTLKSSSAGCTVNGSELKWTVDVPAGKSATVSYVVTNTLKRGSVVDFPAGWVEEIPSRSFSIKVSGARLTDSQLDALKAIGEGVTPAALALESFEDLNFFNIFYKEILGADIKLPKTVAEYMDIQFKAKKPLGQEEKYLTIKDAVDAQYQYLNDMALPKFLTGYSVSYGSDGHVTSTRAMEIQEEYFKPGDLFITWGDAKSASKTVIMNQNEIALYIYLGNHNVLRYTTEGAKVEVFTNNVAKGLIRNLFCVLRPTLGHDSLAATVAKPEDSAAEILDVAQLNELAKGGIKASAVQISESLALTAPVDLSGKKILVAAGKTLNLGDNDIIASGLSLGADAKLVAGAGRIRINAVNESQLEEMLAKFEGQAVLIGCAFSNADINNTYDCYTKTSHYTALAAVGATVLKSILACTPSGWTLEMDNGLVTNTTQEIVHENVTINLNGMRIGTRAYTGKDFSVIDTAGGGYFVIRGNSDLSDDTQTTSIYAPGIPVHIGFTSDSSGAHSSDLKLEGTLTYGELILQNGSKITPVGSGKLVQQDVGGAATEVVLEPTVPTVSEALKVLSAGTSVTLTEDLTLDDNVSVAHTDVIVGAGKTLDLGKFRLTVKSITVEQGAQIITDTGRIVFTAADDASAKELAAKYAGLPVTVKSEYPDADIVNEFDCLTCAVNFKPATASVGYKNLTAALAAMPDNWTLFLRTGLVSSNVPEIIPNGLTIDINGMSFGMKNYTGNAFRVVNSKPGQGGFYFRGAEGGDARELETSIDATGVTVALGWSTTNTCNLTVKGSLTYGELVLNNGSTAEGNLKQAN